MDDALQRYIERALQLADERKDELDEQDLAEIARELGLTDADLARVEQAIADHLDRGRGYADHGMWDDAIREFEEAAAIAPTRAPVRLALAHALAERWAATDYPDDKMRAEQLVRAVIEAEPSSREAYKLLARLNPTSAPAPPEQPAGAGPAPSRGSPIAPIVLTLGILSVVVASVVVVVLMPSEPAPSTPAIERPPTVEIEPYESGEVDLPVEYLPKDGLSFKARRSRLAKYPEKAFYKMWGDFEVTDEIEVEEIEVGLKLLNGAGEVVKQHVEKAWASHEATLRRGDHGVFTLLVETPRDAESVVLDVLRVEESAAGGAYAASPIVEPKVTVTVPDHLKLEIRERSVSFSPMMNGPKGFFEASWEFANVGDVPIRELTYTVTILDSDGAQLAMKKKLATFKSHPPIEPGDVFLESTIEMIDHAHERYELAIIELE